MDRTKEFIEKSKKLHGDKYDYSKVDYKNTRTKVCIICPIHGEFWQLPNSHINGNGCKFCAIERIRESLSSNAEEFVKRAREVHGDKYDYSKVEYKNANTKVCIICPIHGEFWQLPTGHLNGQGCQRCYGNNISNTEEFIENAKKIHGDKYDYSKVDYKNNKVKVCIICPEHGEFWQKPNGHLSGNGCKKCSYVERGKNKSKTTEQFIEAAKQIHGNKYDYSKVDYKNNHTKVCIICPEHGEFWQKPNNHLTNKQDCPKCKQSKLEKELALWLQSKNINYVTQKKFEWLKSKQNYLRLDFYLPDYNVAIECQGGQHFFQVEHFGGEEAFKKQQIWDKLKKKLCNEHGIKMIYYTKKEFKNDSNITDKRLLLKEIINNF